MMMWKRLHNKKSKGGFTLLEMMAVVAIIVVLLGVTIVGIVSMRKTMKLKEYDDYAKTIFMAAQSNLSAMRANGELEGLQAESESGWYRINQFPKIQFPYRDAGDEYYWTGRHLEDDDKKADTFAMVLPVNSVEAALRDNWVVIEYNPITGNVYSAFYCPANSLGRETLWGLYLNGNLPRDEASRRKLGIGYYCGSILTSKDLEPKKTDVEMEFTNGEEGILDIGVAMPDGLTTGATTFMDGLDVKLTLTGEISGNSMELDILSSQGEDLATVSREGTTVKIRYVLDSLANYSSFANLAAGESASITSLTDQRRFTLLPGENLTIQAEVSYNGKGIAMDSKTGILAGVNPMFDYLLPGSAPGTYVLAVSNGRNLQNLNALVPGIADAVELVVFSQDIYWNQTVAYYNNVYGTGGVYTNAADEAPARALPYFVPIHNELLLGSAWFNGTGLQYSHENYASGGSVLTRDYADVIGNGKKVVGLRIDSTRYAIPAQGHYYVTNGYINADGQKVGGKPTVGYHYTGLFAYANTNISDLSVVNPYIKGLSFAGDPDLTVATGSLVGVAGPNALLMDCGAYIITDGAQVMGCYDYNAMNGPKAYSASAEQTWYGVSGQGAVGGLVGYSMSARVATGDLTEDTKNLAFVRCFSAVSVSGGMRGNGDKNFGYTNGVGGLVGVSNLSNFLSCYASGDVLASGVYVSGKTTAWPVLDLDGKVSAGVGGFVGTSHGSRFSNCFATGDVTGDAQVGAGGFVGVMCYDGGFDYRCDGLSVPLKQLTVFNSCYCVGEVTNAGGKTENFAGGMASDKTDAYITSDSKLFTDYYLMYAPYWAGQGISVLQTPGSVAVPDLSKTNSGYFYIYKDSYYLERGRKEDTVIPNTLDCGSASGYNHMMNMLSDHGRDTTQWIIDQISVIGNCTNEYGQTYMDAYMGLTKYPLLMVSYGLEMAKGYDKAFWIEATAELTHPYSFTGGKYLFPLTSGMEYYGDWPTFPLSGGLAYYEYYSDDGSVHAQFDRIDTSDLASAQSLKNRGAYVTSDGYAVALATGGQSVKVELGGKTFDLSGVGTTTWSYGANTVTLYPLTAQVMSEAAGLGSSDKFYVEMTITTGNKSYIVYFNPNVANSQINPIMVNDTNHANPAKPSGIPGQIQIRSARQLAALSNAPAFWASDYNYVQVLDLYAGSYSGGSIGNDTTPFQGSYVGAGGQMTISGVSFSGIFGTIGENGLVKDVKVIVSGDTSDGSDEYSGIVADVNHGTLDNVDVTVSGAVTVKASKGAGLLAGFSDGKLYNCDIHGNEAVTLSADKVGGAVGVLEGTVTGCTVSLNGYQAEGESAGGFAGEASDADVSNVQVTMDNGVTAKNWIGGFCTTVNGGNYSNITVKLNGDAAYSANVGLYGAVGDVEGAKLEDLNVTINGALQAKHMAGLANILSNSSLSNSSVVINGTVDAADYAVGAVRDCYADSTITAAVVTLSGALRSESGEASGLAGSVSGTCTASEVRLNGGTISGRNAAGFAMEVSGEGEISGYCAVTGSGTVNGIQQAAGFVKQVSGLVAASRVTPAAEQSAHAYWGLSNDGLVVTGGKAAGFVVNVGKDGSVVNCDALCTVSGSDVSGFADSNSGSVDGCIANVTITGGYAFVGVNDGEVTNCYGWYGDGEQTNTTSVTVDGHTSCYFADLDIQEKDSPDAKSVLLIDSQGKLSDIRLSELNSTLGKLNGGTMGVWQIPGAYAGYPYSQIGGYPFPMLRDHCGDWSATETKYFGVIYYEEYDDSSFKVHVVELSTARDGQASLSYYWNNGTMQSTSCFDATGNIVDAGYLLFCMDGTDPFGGNLIGTPYTGSDTIETLINNMAHGSGYQVYNLNTTEKFSFYSLGQTVEVVPYFADAIGQGGVYQIRTPDQLSHIYKSEGSFIQTRDITLNGDFNALAADAPSAGVELKSGQVYDGNGFKINAFAAKNTWIRTLGGTVKNVTMVVGTADSELIRTVSGGALISNLNLILQQPMSSKSAIIGSTYGGVHISSVVINATKVEGKLVRTMTDGLLQVDSIRAEVARTEVGTLFGTITGGVIKGGEIRLENAVLTDYLVESVIEGAGIESFSIYFDQMQHSLIGTLSGNVKDIHLETVTASVGVDGGILVAEVKKELGPSNTIVPVYVEDCGIHVDEAYATGGEFAVISKFLPSNAVVKDCTVNVHKAIYADCQVVGGLIVNNEGTMENCGVMAVIEARDCQIVGGAVAINSGTMENCLANTDVRYTQTRAERGNAIIGGLIGRADGGYITADPNVITVAGSVSLVSEAVNTGKRSYIVGGAIGKDNAKSLLICTGVQANVAIDSKWAGASDVTGNKIDIADKGPVGMFVGYVYRCGFTDCGSLTSNSLYQFAGQIGFSNFKTTGGNWFMHNKFGGGVYEYTMSGSDTLKTIGYANGFNAISDGQTYNVFFTGMQNCTFVLNGQQYAQGIEPLFHLFTAVADDVASTAVFTHRYVAGSVFSTAVN